jgi:hypothetical protein
MALASSHHALSMRKWNIEKFAKRGRREGEKP